MCEASATAADIRMAMPGPITGSAVDPIMLEPVDEVVVTTLVDNVYDALLDGDETVKRAPFSAGTAAAGDHQIRDWPPVPLPLWAAMSRWTCSALSITASLTGSHSAAAIPPCAAQRVIGQGRTGLVEEPEHAGRRALVRDAAQGGIHDRHLGLGAEF